MNWDAVEGRLAGLSLLLAEVMATLARESGDPHGWIDKIEGTCDLIAMRAKQGLETPIEDEALTIRAAREQAEDTLRVVRERVSSPL